MVHMTRMPPAPSLTVCRFGPAGAKQYTSHDLWAQEARSRYLLLVGERHGTVALDRDGTCRGFWSAATHRGWMSQPPLTPAQNLALLSMVQGGVR